MKSKLESLRSNCDKCITLLCGKWWITWFDKNKKKTFYLCKKCYETTESIQAGD